MDDPFCMKHNVPYDAFEGCWRCTGEARDREDEKRRATNENDAEIARLRAELAMWKRATGYDDAERLDFVLGRAGIDTHINVLAKMRDDAQRERDEARRDLTEAIIRESEANRELGREQMRSEAARRELDELIAALPSERVLLMFATAVPHHPLFSQAMRDECADAIERMATAIGVPRLDAARKAKEVG